MDVSPANSGTVKIDQNTPPGYPYKTSYVSGNIVVLEATPSSGYTFQGWSGSYTANSNPFTITMDCSKNVVANFVRSESPPVHPESYQLTMQISGNGSITPQAGIHTYAPQTTVSIEAVADKGWQFESWTGDVANPKSPSTRVTLDANKTCTAKFSRITHTLTIQVKGNGSITPSAGNYTYNDGTTILLTATPDKGWQFDSWTGDVVNLKSPSTRVTLDATKTCTANFSRVILTPWRITGIVIGIIIIGVALWLILRRRSY